MARARKLERNEQLFLLRERNPDLYSFEKLGEVFNIKKETAWEIYHREARERLSTPLIS